MDSKRKHNPFSQVTCDTLTKPKELENPMLTIDQLPNVMTYSSVGVSSAMTRQNLDHQTLFNDPVQVQQWVATSATGSIPAVGHAYPVLPGNYSEDSFCDVSGTVPEFPGPNMDMISDSLLSLSGGSGFYEQDYSLDTLAGNLCATFPMDPVFSDDGLSTGENVALDAWTATETQSFGLPISAEMMYTASSDSNCLVDGVYHDCQRWTNFSNSLPDGLPQVSVPDPQTTWSSPSTASMEPSLASCCSHDGHFSRHLGSPTSLTSGEDFSSDSSNSEDPMLSPLSLGGPTQTNLLPLAYDNMQFEAASTLRPADGFQRAPLTGLQHWPSCDSVDHPPLVSPTMDMYMHRRHSGEGDNANARRNHLYQLGPKEDDLYHCPFEVSENCKHKPEKLKCNYDKHLDSHLKPYRCKAPACVSVPFSSTACLLRHEREAHGMHGHGDKPYLCTFPDCERSLPGNGFPRRWNLQDHMKRVHDYSAPSINGRTSPVLADVRFNRSRRASSNSHLSVGKKVGKTATRPVMPSKQKQSFKKKLLEYSDALQQRGDFLDVSDASPEKLRDILQNILASNS